MNQLILGDCLEVMRKMDTESIDLIYLDPPFFSNRNYEVIWGDKGEVRSFEDRWSGGIDHYDAWGRMRDPNTLEYINNYLNPQLTIIPRGYTGHEHLESFAIINMNGRIYDPAIGRFFSPDNYIQQPDNPQSYNRYSYCINNPLKYTDPSGEVFGIDDFIIAATISALVSASTQAVLTGTVNWTNVGVSAITAGLTAGFGGVPDILLGAAYGAASNVLANGIANVIMGNKFGDNWLSSAISGAIFGGIKGGLQAAKEGRNIWWGSVTAKNNDSWTKFPWSPWKKDIAYKIQFYEKFRAGSRSDFVISDLVGERVSGDQLGIVTTATINNNEYSQIQFIQTVDVRNSGTQVLSLDVLPSSTPPFYMANPNGSDYAKFYKWDAGILDGPVRLMKNATTSIFENIPNISWSATTSVLGLNSASNWIRMESFTWGFEINALGVMSVTPIQYNVTPSLFHLNQIPR